MSRFLARALATARAEVAPIARLAPVADAPQPGFGGFGGFGERGENGNVPPPLPAPAWPDGADYWLTADAVKLAGLLNAGGTARICPNDGIDAWDATGLYRGFSPDLVRRMRAAGLLPASLGGGAP